MKRTFQSVSSDKPIFWEPSQDTSALSVVKELRKYVFLHGASRVNAGAHEVSLVEWFKRHDANLVIDVAHEVGIEPILFYENYQSSDENLSIDLLFTAEHIYRPVVNTITGRLGEFKCVSVAPVSHAELVSLEQLIPEFGYTLAQDLNCMFWRIIHNPKEFGVSAE